MYLTTNYVMVPPHPQVRKLQVFETDGYLPPRCGIRIELGYVDPLGCFSGCSIPGLGTDIVKTVNRQLSYSYLQYIQY
jgi:hypothetical protein